MVLKKCECCGENFYAAKRSVKYCSDPCRREMMRQQARERNKSPYEKREKKMDRIAEINQKARDAGMSYGKYVGMLYLEELKRRKR